MNLEKFISINWYIDRKPYKISTEIDLFYLRICRDLFILIDRLVHKHQDVVEMDQDDCREMAYIFTAYFEDQVSEIGLWKALTELHKKHFGKRVPFFDPEVLRQQEEYFGDILPADIHYLAYISYRNMLTFDDDKPVVMFNTPFLLELTECVFDYLEAREEVFVTDFYNEFLQPESDILKFKYQLNWFVYKSYLTGLEFSRKLDDHSWNLSEQETGDEEIRSMIYAEQDRLLFEVPSSLTAFFPIDILAGVMRCNEKKKQEISNLKWRPHGIFQIKKETTEFYHFFHTATGEEFEVRIDSFDRPVKSPMDTYWITTLIRWNDEYHISGLCISSPYKGEAIDHQNLRFQHRFQTHFEPYRKHLIKTAEEYSERAIRFFGNELVVFDSGYQLQDKLNEFHQWYFDTVVDQSKVQGEKKPVIFNLPPDMLNTNGIALFIPQKDGFEFVFEHRELLHLLQTKEVGDLTFEDLETQFVKLSGEAPGANYWQYLYKNFSIPNLSALLKCPVDSEEDFDALLHIYKSEDFSPLKLPAFSTFTSEEISSDTARRIFDLDNENENR